MNTNESFEDRRAREQAEQLLREQEAQAYAEKVAKELGAAFEVDKDSQTVYMRRIKLSLAGRTFSFYFNCGNNYGKDRDRMEVAASWPVYKDANGNDVTISPREALGYPERDSYSGSNISVNYKKRSAEQVARDIKRRFLPNFEALYDKCVEYCGQRAKSSASVKERAQSFAKEFGSHGLSSARIHDGSADVYVPKTRVNVSSEGVRLESFYCSDETARKILRLLAEDKQK